jgi:FtsP/CotA-like multicopper oxidase with cupredoxin domain
MDMKSLALKKSARSLTVIMAVALVASATAANAAETVVDLRADVTTLTMPGGAVVTMWGYALGAGPVTVPGPAISVPPGDTLRINLTNNLGAAVSVMIPGEPMPLDGTNTSPQVARNPDGRIRSFTHETAPGQTASYVWPSLKPGSYVYQSATHPAVQVQMGLYGAFTHDAAAGSAYPGVPYDRAVTLLYSEIDPALHDAVRDGVYGTPAYPSTINYKPDYYLINGVPYSDPPPAVPTAVVGERVLLRLMNAGLQTHTPTLFGLHASLVAEDGNLYTQPLEQYAVMLPAGKTIDAVVVPTAAQEYPILDRSLNLANALAGPGGMLTYLDVAAN